MIAAARLLRPARLMFAAAAVGWALSLPAKEGQPAAATAADAPLPASETPAPDGNDLGDGLRYARLADLSSTALAAIPARGAKERALVVDLRTTVGEAAGAAALGRWLQERTAPEHPVFILLSQRTPAAVRAALPDSAGLLTLGATVEGLPVMLAVKTDAARDLAACEAIAAGRPLRDLIDEKIEKQRFDEARLVRSRSAVEDDGDDEPDTETKTPAGHGAPAKSKTGEAPAPERGAAEIAAPKTPPKDLVLERAVFVYRAWLALHPLAAPAP